MMGSGEDDAQQARLYTSTDAMESLVLEDNPHSYLSTSDYRSAMSGGGSVLHDAHPLATTPEFKDSYRKGFQDNSGRSNSFRDTMIEPPSYADAIFSPYMGDDSNGSARDSLGIHSARSFSPSPSSSEFLTVRVSDPQKVQDPGNSLVPGGSSSFVTYKFTTHTNISSYLGSEFCVKRRFRDVVALADRLAESYRGYFIPPRPDKSVVESQVMQKVEFIEQRKAALEKYFARLAAHPVLRHSEELRKFLETEGRLPLQPTSDIASRMLDGAVKLPLQLFGESSTMLSPQEAAQPARGGRDLLRMFKELKQSVTNDWSSGKPIVIEEDKAFLEKKDKLTDLERQLSYASQQAEAWVKGQQEVGEVMGDLGLAFIKLAKFETENSMVPSQRAFATDAKRTATAAVKASRFYRESNALSVKHLDELHEYLGLMQAVHTAFADRHNALITVQTLATDVVTINKQIEKSVAASNKVFGGSKSQNRKTEELKESLKNTEEASELAQKQYDQIKERNKAELERFEEERNRDFMSMLRGLVQTQVGYSKKMANVWTKVAEEAAGSSNRSSEASSSGFSTPN